MGEIMNDKIKQMMDELGAWIDAEGSGLEYERATHWCQDCPEGSYADWKEYVKPMCCKEAPDYQFAEWETIDCAKNALKALAELHKKLTGEQ
jgi:hypothetical protein